MQRITVDGVEVELSPISEILDLIGLEEAVLSPFKAAESPADAIWEDADFCTRLIERLAGSIPAGSTVDSLPKIPDQLAILLRGELTLASGKFPLSAEDKDQLEEHLQNVLRPIIYAHIDQLLTGQMTESDTGLIEQVVSKSVTVGWQTVQAGLWQISEIESILGQVGFRFESEEITYIGSRALTPKSTFFTGLSHAVLSQIQQA